MENQNRKPIIAITCGDINGIGIEVIIKSLSDNRMLDYCTPIIFCNNHVISFYNKLIPESHFNFFILKDLNKPNTKQVNVYNCWTNEIKVQPGELNEIGGQYALISIQKAVEALMNKQVDSIVTAPIHKQNIQSKDFNFTGHTPYFKNEFNASEVLMILFADKLKVALLSEHIPLKDISNHLSQKLFLSKINLLNQSLKEDFNINIPKIAVLGLNPHAGDKGLVGKEEIEIIIPAIQEAKNNMLVYGPYSADGFFAHSHFKEFDAVLAMYHDQGLIPFKTLYANEGVNFTAGLPIVRTSPDHGTAFDIAGKNLADHHSFLQAIFENIEIQNNRINYMEMHMNPLKKLSAKVLYNAIDE